VDGISAASVNCSIKVPPWRAELFHAAAAMILLWRAYILCSMLSHAHDERHKQIRRKSVAAVPVLKQVPRHENVSCD